MNSWKRLSLRCLALMSPSAADWQEQKRAATCWSSSRAGPSNCGTRGTVWASHAPNPPPPLVQPWERGPIPSGRTRASMRSPMSLTMGPSSRSFLMASHQESGTERRDAGVWGRAVWPDPAPPSEGPRGTSKGNAGFQAREHWRGASARRGPGMWVDEGQRPGGQLEQACVRVGGGRWGGRPLTVDLDELGQVGEEPGQLLSGHQVLLLHPLVEDQVEDPERAQMGRFRHKQL